MGIIPEFRDRGSQLNDWSRWMGPVWLVVLIAAIVVLQQVARSFHEERLAEVPAARAAREDVTEPGISQLTVMSKQLVKLTRLGAEDGEEPDEEARDETESDLGELDRLAQTRVDRLRVALVAGELLGKDEALKRIGAIEKEAGPESTLASDLTWFARAYDEKPDIPDEARQSLIARHGWFARLAFSYGQPDSARKEIVGHGERIAMLGLTSNCLFLVTAVLAVVLMVGTIVAIRRREWTSELETTTLPGVVYLEMFLVFLLFFAVLLGLQIFTMWTTGAGSVAGLALSEMLLWLLPLSLLWPRLRGLDWSELATDLGLSQGAGPAIEIKAGIVGYLAAMPVVMLVGILSRVLEDKLGGEEGNGIGGYSYFEPTLGNSWIPVILGTFSAVVWAPVTEEIMLRGAFYRALRGRLGIVLSVIISAAVFGAIHPYSTSGLLTVGTSGVMFALLREWRGSLIAPMTAHFLNNGTISLMEILFLWAVD